MTTEPVPKPPKEEEVKEPKEPKPLPDPKPIPEPIPDPPPEPNDPAQDFEPPTEIAEEDLPTQPQAPSSIDGTAVITVGDMKFGWQDPPIAKPEKPVLCYHIGTVAAKSQLKEHAVGHEWICNCGTVFVVTINSGGKKTLIEKKEPVDGQE